MISKNNINKKRGFTIIEVVLVLAIAGLIFLMVFIAFPALQRAQRNTQRRNDYSMLVAAVESYMASNNGKLSNLIKEDPHSLDGTRWINGTGEDPNGNPYELLAYSYSTWSKDSAKPGDTTRGTAASCSVAIEPPLTEEKCKQANADYKEAVAGDPASQVFIVIGANCTGVDDQGDPQPSVDDAKRAFSVYGYLEGGGYFCQDSGAIGHKE